jgi:hypothetical protein
MAKKVKGKVTQFGRSVELIDAIFEVLILFVGVVNFTNFCPAGLRLAKSKRGSQNPRYESWHFKEKN